MNKLDLSKKKHDKPEFDDLYKMLSDLEAFLDEDVDFNDDEWKENLDAIIDFQDLDGSFKFFESYKIPGDARVEFCYMPTYICTAVLMKAYLTDQGAFKMKETSALLNGLKMSCVKKLRGHGFEGLKGLFESLEIFKKGGLNEFIDLHPDFCPEFTEMVNEVIASLDDMEFQGKFKGPWGESFEEEIKAANQYFRQRQVFVYGTLMRSEANNRYLEDSTFIGAGILEGYEMYDVGWYPAIVAGDGIAIGELYQVPIEDIPSIDRLEGEGTLYAKKCERVTINGETTFAYVYVYLGDVSSLKRISSWKEHVWYVSYGSNMSYDRFMCYIKGGTYGSSVPRAPCKDTTPPVAVKAVKIPFGMYFAEESRWGGGVSFLDISKEGHSLGVAYLITKEQFIHVATQENGNNFPDGTVGWYKDIICLGKMNGFEKITITSDFPRDYNNPTDEYLEVLRMGIRQNWPEMSDDDIEDYLESCMR